MLAILAPLALWPVGLDRWALPKLLVIGVAAVLAAVGPSRGRIPLPLLALGGAAAVLAVVAALGGSDPIAALLGRWPRFEGLVAGGGYLLAALLGARLLGPRAMSSERRLAETALCSAALLLALASILEVLGLRVLPGDLQRAGALLGNATDQGALAAALTVVLVVRLLTSADPDDPMRVVALAGGAAAAAVTVVLSGSRIAGIALALGLLAAAVLAWRTRRGRGIGLLALGVVALGGVAAVAVVAARGLDLLGADLTGRLVIWGEAWAVLAGHPLRGVGPNGFADAVAKVHGTGWFARNGDAVVLDSPHQLLLQAALVGGPVLGVVALVTLVAAIVAVLRRRDADADVVSFARACALGAAMPILVLMTHVTSPGVVVPAAFLAGAAVAVEPRTGRRVRPIVFGSLATGWLALVAVTAAAEVRLGDGAAAAARGDAVVADEAFASASALRGWDPTTESIAAEALTAQVSAGDLDASESARRWAQRALARNPASLPAAKACVELALLADDRATARAVLADMVMRFPGDPWVAHRAGALAVVDGDPELAEELLLRATRLDPTRPEPWDTLAYLYGLGGDPDAAVRAQEEAARLRG